MLHRVLHSAGVDFALAEARGPVVERARRARLAGILELVGEDPSSTLGDPDSA